MLVEARQGFGDGDGKSCRTKVLLYKLSKNPTHSASYVCLGKKSYPSRISVPSRGFSNGEKHTLTGRLLSFWRSGVLAVLAFWPFWRDLQSGFQSGAVLAEANLVPFWPFWRPPRSGDGPVRTARNDPEMTPN